MQFYFSDDLLTSPVFSRVLATITSDTLKPISLIGASLFQVRLL